MAWGLVVFRRLGSGWLPLARQLYNQTHQRLNLLVLAPSVLNLRQLLRDLQLGGQPGLATLLASHELVAFLHFIKFTHENLLHLGDLLLNLVLHVLQVVHLVLVFSICVN